ncbi:glycosyltransferase [Pseudomonas schmalbachii]|uniref:Glycosyltransferase n=1 Tax=Pseudomonas schmalbachii TaxID=2816993 RepID=A0ABS3TU14_9PSED|nr:glycosyltransferase [Pseudomonas schmalbachii]MBO3277152.1 glycosyltransferase [Pseudomonas schmalbachii]
MKILHVTDCYAGGVSRAIDTITKITPTYDHYLAWSGKESPTEKSNYIETFQIHGGILKKVKLVRTLVNIIRPDIVHAHSSWAGVYTRLLPLPCRVIYQPHCFAFDDPERKPTTRAFYFLAESILSRNSECIIHLSEHEKKLACKINSKAKSLYLPNAPTIQNLPSKKKSNSIKEIVMVGRLAPQKAPFFFAETIKLITTEENIKFTWIGDGEEKYRKMLSKLGVEVTGWLDEVQLANRLSSACIYFHTASYEGYPLSVLDAASSGLAVLVRDIPAFSEDTFIKVKTPSEAAASILELIKDTEKLNLARQANNATLARMNYSTQKKALLNIYNGE